MRQLEPTSSPRPRSAAGYTLIEVMLTGSIAVLGFAALFSLQVRTTQGITDARDRDNALNLAEHFTQLVRMAHFDGALDNGTNIFASPNDALRASNTTAWSVFNPPDASGPSLTVGPGTAFQLSAGDPDFGLAQEFPQTAERKYCIHYRISWVIPDRVFRADVRVLWPRPGTDLDVFEPCGLQLVPAIGLPATVGMVTHSTVVALL